MKSHLLSNSFRLIVFFTDRGIFRLTSMISGFDEFESLNRYLHIDIKNVIK